MRNTYDAFLRFFRGEVIGGIVLFLAALLAIFVANADSLSAYYEHWLHAPIGLLIGEQQFSLSLAHFINDGLMAVFFLLVGLEIKREMLTGELSTKASASLPAIAAGGGMLVPALIYVFFNWGDAETLRGWAIPTATDIAFSLGVLSLLGKRVPVSIKIFLTAVAVIDDLGAIAIIALFYTANLSVAPLFLALIVIFCLFLLNRNGIVSRLPYMVGFLLLWVCLLQSGVHATLAGVAVAMAIPLRVKGTAPPPLIALETDLHHLVIFIILPLFAFANAGVNFAGMSLASLAAPVPLGIGLGLIVGKSIGITAAVWLALKIGVSAMPRGCSWSAIVGVAFLCGIGFTVSLFIGNLAFGDNVALINSVKIGVLAGSFVAGLAGFLFLRFVAFRR